MIPLWTERGGPRGLDVLAVGEGSLDRVCRLRGAPAFPGKAPLLGEQELPGGQGATAALACARLGLRTAYVGAVGGDAAAERVLAPLREAGIDLGGVERCAEARTRRALVLVDVETGERSVLADRDPRLRLGAGAVPEERLRAARVLLLDGSEPELAAALLARARGAGVPTVLDLDALDPDSLALARSADFPIVSEAFASALAPDGTPGEGLRRLARPPVRLAVATLGARGALARAEGQLHESPSFRVQVADTTGAGDAFHAGFAWALLRGLGVAEALRAANAAGGLGCRGVGAQGGLPDARELERLLRGEKRSAEEDGHGP